MSVLVYKIKKEDPTTADLLETQTHPWTNSVSASGLTWQEYPLVRGWACLEGPEPGWWGPHRRRNTSRSFLSRAASLQTGALREKGKMTGWGSSWKQSRAKIRGQLSPQSAALFALTEADLADNLCLNLIHQFAVRHTVLDTFLNFFNVSIGCYKPNHCFEHGDSHKSLILK